MIIGVFAKPHRTDFALQLKEILTWLESNQVELLIEESVVENFGLSPLIGTPGSEIPSRANAVVVFGGDGTLLSVARLIKGRDCPILGVNLGSLGFLTEIVLEELYPVLKRLLAGSYRTERRSLLQADLVRAGNTQETYHALNDVVINKSALARVIRINVFFDNHFLSSFVADGMIVSTPTGSTAYSLSAGGPIVYPRLPALLITPICPHTLTNRPVVIPADQPIRMVLESDEAVMLTVDGQVGRDLQQGDEVICTRSPFEVELIRPEGRGFFDVLREKLKWGER